MATAFVFAPILRQEGNGARGPLSTFRLLGDWEASIRHNANNRIQLKPPGPVAHLCALVLFQPPERIAVRYAEGRCDTGDATSPFA